MFAHRAILEHEVLQRVPLLQTEPEKLLPALTVESNRIREGIVAFLVPLPRSSVASPRASTPTRPPTSSPGVSSSWDSQDDGTSRTPLRWLG